MALDILILDDEAIVGERLKAARGKTGTPSGGIYQPDSCPGANR